MSSHPVLPLILERNIEPQKSWEGISTPMELAEFMARVLSIDPNQLLQFEETVYSDVQPTGSEATKLWIKTDEPVAIGLPSEGSYKLIYQYPANIPFLFDSEADLPSYFRKLTSQELTDYSLTDPVKTTANWVIMPR